MRGRDTELQFVFDDRAADRTKDVPRIVGPSIAPSAAYFEVIAGLARDDVDCATQGVLAVDRALRSAKNFDAFDVDQRVVQVRRIGLVDAVDEDADARLNGLHQRDAHAADGNEHASGTVAVDVEVGRQQRHVFDRNQAATLDRLARNGGRG